MPRTTRKEILFSDLDVLIVESLDLSERTKDLYRECVSAFVSVVGAHPSAWTAGAAESWLYRLTRGRQPQTVNVYRKALRYASRRFAKHGGVDFASTIDKVKTKPSEPREPLTYEEAAMLLGTCDDSLKGIRDRALLVLALRSGLRRGGLKALQISGIRPPKITTINKGGNSITFEADAETFAVLDAWIECLRLQRITTGPVFRVIRRDAIQVPMSAFQIWNVFDTRAKAAQIRHVFPHLARHSTVTWLREEGMSAAEVSKLTGQTERTIENIYTHVRTRGAVGNALPTLIKKP
jgi:integrase